MRKVKILTDSCSDLSTKLLEKYDIDYAKMSVLENGVSTPALLSWTEQDAHELYEKIRAGKRISTSQVSADEFRAIFTKYLNEGCDIVYIGCSTKQSSSVNSSMVVANELSASYPDASIYCIDSLNASIGEGILAIEASKMATNGADAKEIFEHISSIRNNVLQFITVHSLDTLKRAGRVSASSAFFGNLLGIKPILISDAQGTQVAYKKVKGRLSAIKECISLLKEGIERPEEQTIYLWHSDCDKQELANVESMLKEEINCKEVEIGNIGPIIGASIGPSVIGLWAFGKEVTFVAED